MIVSLLTGFSISVGAEVTGATELWYCGQKLDAATPYLHSRTSDKSVLASTESKINDYTLFATFDSKTGTLTFNNGFSDLTSWNSLKGMKQIETAEGNPTGAFYGICANGSLTINMGGNGHWLYPPDEGTDSNPILEEAVYGVYVDGNLTINGDDGGVLKVAANPSYTYTTATAENYQQTYGVYVNGKLTLNGGLLDIYASTYAPAGQAVGNNRSTMIKATEAELNGGKLKLRGRPSGAISGLKLYDFGDNTLNIPGYYGQIWSADDTNPQIRGFENADLLKNTHAAQQSGDCYASIAPAGGYEIAVAGMVLRPTSKYLVKTESGWTSSADATGAVAEYNAGTKTLKFLTDAEIDYSVAGISNVIYSESDLTVDTNGKNITLSTMPGYMWDTTYGSAIRAEGTVTVTGGGTLNAKVACAGIIGKVMSDNTMVTDGQYATAVIYSATKIVLDDIGGAIYTCYEKRGETAARGWALYAPTVEFTKNAAVRLATGINRWSNANGYDDSADKYYKGRVIGGVDSAEDIVMADGATAFTGYLNAEDYGIPVEDGTVAPYSKYEDLAGATYLNVYTAAKNVVEFDTAKDNIVYSFDLDYKNSGLIRVDLTGTNDATGNLFVIEGGNFMYGLGADNNEKGAVINNDSYKQVIYPAGKYNVKLELNFVQKTALITLTMPNGRIVRRGGYEFFPKNDSGAAATGAKSISVYTTPDITVSNAELTYPKAKVRNFISKSRPIRKGFDQKAYNLVTSFDGDAKTTRSFAWTAVSEFDNMAVKYAKASDFASGNNIQTVNAVKETPISGESEDTKNDLFYYKADITGLQPGTKYTYVIGDLTDDEWSGEYTFETEAENVKDFKFVAITDTQGSAWYQYQTAIDTFAAAMEEVPDTRFILHAGDVVNENAEENWNMYFEALKGVGETVPHFAAAGNHESWPGNGTEWSVDRQNMLFDLHFNHPNNGAAASQEIKKLENTLTATTGNKLIDNVVKNADETVYSFNYGNVHVAVLNTGSGHKAAADNLVLEAQRAWLDADLKAASDATWKIIMMHQGVYNSEGINNACNALQDVIESNGVDLVINGHEHRMIRTYPIKNAEVVTSTGNPDRVEQGIGTVYLNIGNTTTGPFGIKNSIDECMMVNNSYIYNPTYTVFDVSDGELKVQIKYPNGQVLDSFKIYNTEVAELEGVFDSNGNEAVIGELSEGEGVTVRFDYGDKTADSNDVFIAGYYDADGVLQYAQISDSVTAVTAQTYEAEFTMPNLSNVSRISFFVLDSLASLSPLSKSYDLYDDFNVLIIGNSFSLDGTSYLDQLSEAAGVRLNVGVVQHGGSNIKNHWENRVDDSTYFSYTTYGSNTGVSKDKVSLSYAFEQADWDLILMQQWSNTLMNNYNLDSTASEAQYSWQPYMNNMAEFVKEKNPNAKLGLQFTWAFEKGYGSCSNWTDDVADDAEAQRTMYNNLVANYKQAANDVSETIGEPVIVVPTGYAVQYARDNYDKYNTSFSKSMYAPYAGGGDFAVGNGVISDEDAAAGRIRLNRDGYHLSNYGLYLAGCVWLETLTGKSAVGNTFIPGQYNTYIDNSYGTSASFTFDGLSEEAAEELQNIAHTAVAQWKSQNN